jgi:hypothetical protein
MSTEFAPLVQNAVPDGTSGMASSIINLTNTIVGAGLLSVEFVPSFVLLSILTPPRSLTHSAWLD